MILPKKQYQRNRWEVAFVVRNITITAEVEGSKALRKTAFPPLNTFYSSSVFSHLAADESEKFSFLCTKTRTTTIIFLFFIQRRSQRPWIRREGSVPFPTRQAGELQRAPSSQRGPLLVPGWALSPHHIPCRDVTTQQLHAHPPIREVGSPHHSPCSDHGTDTCGVAQGARESSLSMVWLPVKELVLFAPNTKRPLGLTVVHFLTKEAAL